MNWEHIEKTARGLIERFDPFELVTAEEWERFRWSLLTHGQIKSRLRKKVDWGAALLVRGGPDEALRRIQYEDLALELGFGQPGTLARREPRVDNAGIVLQGIVERKVTTEFLMAWGDLHRQVATYSVLMANETDFEEHVKAELGGVSESTEIQKYWYAQWVAKNAASIQRADRDDADNSLAAVCIEIVKGTRLPSAPYPMDWFLRMVTQPKQRKGGKLKSPNEPLELSWRFRRISWRHLLEMVNHPLITPRVLPPLSTQEFKSVPGGRDATNRAD